jgi:hypothetical protein
MSLDAARYRAPRQTASIDPITPFSALIQILRLFSGKLQTPHREHS